MASSGLLDRVRGGVSSAVRSGAKKMGRYAGLLLGLSAIALIWLGTAYSLIRDKQNAEIAAFASTDNLAHALQESISRTLRAADQTLRYARQAYLHHHSFDDNLWTATKEIIADYQLQISFIDKDGNAVISTFGRDVKPDLRDRESFRIHKEGGGEDKLFLSKPVYGRLSQKWELQLTRRIDMPDGSFGGVVVVSLDPEFLARFYRSIDVGNKGVFSVVGTDGIVRVRASRDKLGLGAIVANSPLNVAMGEGSESGRYTNASAVDGVTRQYSYHRVYGFPLYVVVGMARDEILATYKGGHREKLVLAFVATIWIAVITALIARYQVGLKEARVAAESGTRARSEFLAMMSHEIRTPMNGVIGITELLIDSELREDQKRMVRTLRESAEHLLQIINDVLDFSKLEANSIEIERIAMEPRVLVCNAINLFKPLAESKGITIAGEVSPAVPARVLGDPARVRQILFNLVGNAVKFTPAGSVTIKLGASLAGDGRVRLSFAVIDTGIGIAESHRAALFREFSQVDRSVSRRFGGTGLGLVICKRLAERMDGTITVHSEAGVGSTFTFSMTTDVLRPETAGAAVQNVAAPVRQRRLRILLAEDNLTNQMVAVRLLEKLGHATDVVGDGAQAIAAVTQHSYDLVLMDMMMPHVDGLSATRQIRAMTNAAGKVYVIALTANATAQDDRACRAAGMNDFLAKPVTRAQLEAALGRFLALYPEAGTPMPAAATLPAQAAPPLVPADNGALTQDCCAEMQASRSRNKTMPSSPTTPVEAVAPPEFDPAPYAELARQIGADGAAEILASFLADTNERLSLMRRIATDDRALLRNEAHALKSSAATFGFMHLSTLAKTLEHSALETAEPLRQVDAIAAAFVSVERLVATRKIAA